MCDTMVALGNSTKDGSVIFAKNSDRQPNEPHIIVRVPRTKHNPGEKLRCTYIEIGQAEETYEVLLLKPSWIWGCEMGCNEFGLNIGNEAVFTREKYGEDRLTGMDMLRIALERCRTSNEALDMIINLIQEYGQGGNCGYEKKFTYHNSFLIADTKNAWVLETAGEFWAAEEVKDVRSISNCLTIGSNFDRCHPGLIEHAIKMGWCKSEKDFNFAKCYTDPLITRLSGSLERYKVSSSILEREKGRITTDTMAEILRHHEDSMDGKQFSKHTLKSVCMHGGFIYGDHTTGSYIGSLNDSLCTYLITGASTPCISIFKPFWMIDDEPLSYSEGEKDKAIEYWWKREAFHRMVLEGKIQDLGSYKAMRNKLENSISQMISELDYKNPDHKKLIEVMKYAMESEKTLINSMMEKNKSNISNVKGGLYFKHYWKKQNRKLLG